MMIRTAHRTLIATTLVLATSAVPCLSQGTGAGTVGRRCSKDIDKFAGMRHGNADIRACLEAKRSQVSAPCRRALDTTGGGPARNFMRY